MNFSTKVFTPDDYLPSMQRPSRVDFRVTGMPKEESLPDYCINLPEYTAALNAYSEEERRLFGEFKKDMLISLGVADHPLAEKMFSIASRYSTEPCTVYFWAKELAELLV